LPPHFSKKELLETGSTGKYQVGPIDLEPFVEQLRSIAEELIPTLQK
jgi:hypothetical protein